MEIRHAPALLAWIANTRTGTYQDLRSRIEWIIDSDPSVCVSSWAVINSMEMLLYIRKSPCGNYWESGQPTLVLLPGVEGISVFTGCFDRIGAEDSIIESGLWPTFCPPSDDKNLSRFLPDTLYLESSNIESLIEFVRNRSCLTLDISQELLNLAQRPILNAVTLAAGPRFGGSAIDRFELANFSYEPCLAIDEPGLYRQRNLGRLKYWIYDGEQWLSTDRGAGPWQAMRLQHEPSAAQSSINYHPDQQYILLRRELALPRSLHILLTLCSGMLPTSELSFLRFDNINAKDAESIYKYLGIHRSE